MPNDHKAYIAKGAIWRRKKTGALVRITAAKNHASSWNSTPYYDISWETVEKPTRRGVSYQDYWLKNCEPVEMPADVSTPPGQYGDRCSACGRPLRDSEDCRCVSIPPAKEADDA